MSEQTPAPDPLFSRICESSTRLLAGTVHRPVMKELQKTVHSAAGDYPWESVVDRILEVSTPPDELTKQALRAQRDWIVRGGRETPGKSMKYRAKSFIARILAGLIYLAVLVPIVVLLLILVYHQWPEMNIYRIHGWLAEVLPTVFGKG